MHQYSCTSAERNEKRRVRENERDTMHGIKALSNNVYIDGTHRSEQTRNISTRCLGQIDTQRKTECVPVKK